MGSSPTAMSSGSVPPPTFSVPGAYPQYPTQYPAYSPAGSAPSSRPADLSALSRVTVAAILGIVGALLSIVELVATPATSFVTVTTSSTTGNSSVSLNPAAFYLVAAVGAVGVIFTMIELWLYRGAFRELSAHDSRFSTPSKLALLAFVGLVLLIVLAAAVFALVYQATVCAGSGNAITSACLNVGAFLGLIGLLVIVGIATFVGYIGVLIGIWRLGTRYNEGLFKAGAILYIIPFLNFIGLVLILVGARSARRSIENARGQLSFG